MITTMTEAVQSAKSGSSEGQTYLYEHTWINKIVASMALNALKKKKPELFTDIAGNHKRTVR